MDPRRMSLPDVCLCQTYISAKRISLPPLVALPHCQTQMVTKVAVSSSSPEEENCVVAVKFFVFVGWSKVN